MKQSQERKPNSWPEQIHPRTPQLYLSQIAELNNSEHVIAKKVELVKLIGMMTKKQPISLDKQKELIDTLGDINKKLSDLRQLFHDFEGEMKAAEAKQPSESSEATELMDDQDAVEPLPNQVEPK